jgi:uncharacterized protein (TIGR02266 family)
MVDDMEGTSERPKSPALKRRNTTRVDAEFEVDLGSEHNFFTGLGEDISEGGIFIATYRNHAIGDHLAVKFGLPGIETPLRAVVEVRWVREAGPSSDTPPGIGAVFVDITPEDRALVARFIQHRTPLLFE